MENLTKLNNKNYKWFTHMGNYLIVNLLTDEPVIIIDTLRLYFRNELDFYGTSEIHTTTEEAKIVAAAILNSHF